MQRTPMLATKRHRRCVCPLAHAEYAGSTNGNAQLRTVGRCVLVAWDGIEPPTQGFSIHAFLHFAPLIDADRIYINQRVTLISLDE